MNTETGQIYRGEGEINAALNRLEPVVSVSERVADLMEAGQRACSRAEGRRIFQEQRQKRLKELRQ